MFCKMEINEIFIRSEWCSIAFLFFYNEQANYSGNSFFVQTLALSHYNPKPIPEQTG